MAVLSVDVNFGATFMGQLVTARDARVSIGPGPGNASPYDLLLGALASCFYATFLDIVEKKRLSFTAAHITVNGEKREEVPTTLSWVLLKLSIRGANGLQGFEQAATLAGQYCSIYQTLSHVAQMKTELSFED